MFGYPLVLTFDTQALFDPRHRLAHYLLTITQCDPSLAAAEGRITEDEAGGMDRHYELRNRSVLAALGAAAECGMDCGARRDEKDDDEWFIVYIELPTGQASWHIPAYGTPWDGHKTATKYERVKAFVRDELGEGCL